MTLNSTHKIDAKHSIGINADAGKLKVNPLRVHLSIDHLHCLLNEVRRVHLQSISILGV